MLWLVSAHRASLSRKIPNFSHAMCFTTEHWIFYIHLKMAWFENEIVTKMWHISYSFLALNKLHIQSIIYNFLVHMWQFNRIPFEYFLLHWIVALAINCSICCVKLPSNCAKIIFLCVTWTLSFFSLLFFIQLFT